MVKAAITISLVPEARAGPFVFQNGLTESCAQAAALGFNAVEIFPRAAEEVNASELRTLLRQHRLQLAAMGTGAGWLVSKLSLTSPESGVRQRAKDFIGAIIDLAGGFGASAIVGSMQGRVENPEHRPQVLAWLAEALEQLGPRAHAQGVPLFYEPLNRYETNLFNRLGDAVSFLKTLRTSNIKLLADLFHMNLEESSPAQALTDAGAHIGHVHYADSNRHAMGFGHTNVAPIVDALKGMHYQGYLSAEILPLPTANDAAQQTLRSIRHWFAEDLRSQI